MSRLLKQLACFSSRHPWAVLLGGIVVTLLSGWSASRLEVRLSIASLLPDHLPALQDYRESVADFGTGDLILVTVEPPPDVPLAKYRRFIIQYKEALQKLEETREERLHLSREILNHAEKYLEKFSLFLLHPDDLEALSRILDPENIRARLARLKTLQSLPVTRKNFDPLGLVPLISNHFLPSREIQPDSSGEFFVTRDKKLALFILGQEGTVGNTKLTRELLRKAKEIETRLLAPTPAHAAGNPALAPPLITWSGRPIVLLEDQKVLKTTLFWNILSSTLGVTLLFYLFFRGFRPLLWSYLPLAMGITWAFGLAYLLYGGLNALTVSLGGMLIGLGIDFPAYLLNRFVRERGSGKSFPEALEITWGETGVSVVAGATTTIAAFLLLLGAAFPAFRQLGLLAGGGLFLTLAAILILLPALLALMERGTVPKMTRAYPSLLIRGPLSFPKATLAVSLACFTVFGLASLRLRLESPLRETTVLAHAVSNASMDKLNDLSRRLGISLLPFRLIVNGSGWEEALQRNDQLSDLLRRWKEAGKISFFDSLSQWLPSQMRQEEALRRLAALPNLDPKNFSTHYAQGLPKDILSSFFRPMTQHQQYQRRVLRYLSGREPTDQERMKTYGLDSILSQYTQGTPGKIQLANYVYLPATEDYLAAKESLLAELRLDPLFVSGVIHYPSAEGVLEAVNRMIQREVFGFVAGILGLIALLLWLNFRSWRLTIFACLPMVLGGIAVVGSYALFFGPISTMNFLWLPLYLGMATDDAVHLMNIWRKPENTLERALRSTGNVICFTSLTTMVGFGSMALGPFPIMKQAGILIVLAMGWELIASLFLLPALLKLNNARK